MPFYEYQCTACDQQTEVLQKISDAPLKKCPHCGKSTLKRLISAPVFRLKGSGWYETDFKSDQDRKRNLAGGEEAPAAKEEAAKPAAPADAKVEPKEKPAAAEPTAASKSASKPAAAAAKKPAAPSSSARATPTKAKPVAKKKAGRR
jgi:putative FmdB family regulatory protein